MVSERNEIGDAVVMAVWPVVSVVCGVLECAVEVSRCRVELLVCSEKNVKNVSGSMLSVLLEFVFSMFSGLCFMFFFFSLKF